MNLIKKTDKVIRFLDRKLAPLMLLVARVHIASIFWYSGLTKIGSWPTTVALFESEYKVPILAPELSAYLATIFELSCSVLIAFGIATRFASLPLLGMTIVIQTYVYDLPQHWLWMIIFGVLITMGPGRLSIDHYIRKKFMKDRGI